MGIKVRVDVDRITLDDYALFQEIASQSDKQDPQFVNAAKAVLWRFIVGDDNEYLPENEAKEIVGKMGILTAMTAVRDMNEAVRQITQRAVPLETSETSRPPSLSEPEPPRGG